MFAVLLLGVGFAAAAAPIDLLVDAREVPAKRLHVSMVIPVAPGSLSLSYPDWIPGEHGPTGPNTNVAGLTISANGKPLPWKRDPVSMTTVSATVPAGVDSVKVEFDFSMYASGARFSSGGSFTPHLAMLNWNQVLMAPSGVASDSITIRPSLILPAGWEFGTALAVRETQAGRIGFEPVTLTRLVDSPVLTGDHFRTIDLSAPGGPQELLQMAADNDAALQMNDQQIEHYRNLMREAEGLFGAHHFNSYRFLISLSDQVAHFGLEHHECSDDRVHERTWIDSDLDAIHSQLLAHELSHSWNGKYRRPTGLATANYSEPMKGELLWVYEGLTQYLGFVLSARSGARSHELQMDNLALLASYLQSQPGRRWRALEDTAVEAQLLYNAGSQGESWRRGTDFYDEGLLIWLEADVTIRKLTNGLRSLDDFCKRFHGTPSGPPMVKSYRYEDVVAELNAVAPYDWDRFFTARVKSVAPEAPLGGVTGSGWKLVYSDQIGPMAKAREAAELNVDAWYSIGLIATKEGSILDVLPGSPADRAGVVPGSTLLAVNHQGFSRDRLRDAIVASARKQKIELITSNSDFFQSHTLDYDGGPRYPHLERDPSLADLLSEILRPHATPKR